METAMLKIQAAQQQHHVSNTFNLATSFLVTIYINTKEGESCGMKVTITTTAAEVVEFVTTTKNLPPKNYVLCQVLGDGEAERPLHSLEQVLGVQAVDAYLCIKQNTFADKLKPYDSYFGQYVQLHVQEKKKWRKCPCSVKHNSFIIYKDNKCQVEMARVPLSDANIFCGIERKKIDVRNALPTKYPLCLRATSEENNKFLCADTAEDRLMIIAAVILSKHPDGIQTPVMPVKSIPVSFDARNRGISVLHPPPPGIGTIYTNYKPSKTHRQKSDDKLMHELSARQRISLSPEILR